jgi:hypothetical protein
MGRTSGRTAGGRTASSARRQPPKVVVLLLVLGGAAIALGFFGVRAAGSSFGYAAGLSGVHGQLAVTRCWGDNPNKPYLITSCAGEFRSDDDGGVVIEGAVLDGRHRQGELLSVRYGGGACHVYGWAPAAGDLAGVFAAAPLAVLGLLLIVWTLAPSVPVRFVLWCCAGSMGVAGLCLVSGIGGWIGSL